MYFDWEQIERWSRLLADSAESLDAAAKSSPATVDAGPFTPVVMDMVEATAAQYAHLVLRMDAAAERLHRVAEYYRDVEETNAHYMETLGIPEWPLPDPRLLEKRRRAWEMLEEDPPHETSE